MDPDAAMSAATELGQDAASAIGGFLRLVVFLVVSLVVMLVSFAVGVAIVVAVVGFVFGLW